MKTEKIVIIGAHGQQSHTFNNSDGAALFIGCEAGDVEQAIFDGIEVNGYFCDYALKYKNKC